MTILNIEIIHLFIPSDYLMNNNYQLWYVACFLFGLIYMVMPLIISIINEPVWRAEGGESDDGGFMMMVLFWWLFAAAPLGILSASAPLLALLVIIAIFARVWIGLHRFNKEALAATKGEEG